LIKEGIPVMIVEMDRLPNGEGNNMFQEILAMTNQRTVPNIFINGK
jgi:glutaredoxin